MVDTLLFKQIVALPTLKPSPATNEAFSKLVRFCLTAKPEDITLKSVDIAKLQHLSAKAESEMEIYWAKKIITSKDPNKELLAFWYYKNYTDLVDLEYSHFSLLKKNIANVLFVGGGPLPLTAILLSQKYELSCTVLENDKESYELGRKLVASLGLENKIIVQYIDALEYSSYAMFDVVYVASLVGTTPLSKHKIITSTHDKMKSGALLLCRSSHGVRTLLYAPVPNMTLEYLPPTTEVRPSNSIINSFVILQKT
jgi:nicotianamine synthase